MKSHTFLEGYLTIVFQSTLAFQPHSQNALVQISSGYFGRHRHERFRSSLLLRACCRHIYPLLHKGQGYWQIILYLSIVNLDCWYQLNPYLNNLTCWRSGIMVRGWLSRVRSSLYPRQYVTIVGSCGRLVTKSLRWTTCKEEGISSRYQESIAF